MSDLMVIIHCRMRRDEHNGEDWFLRKKRTSRPSGLDLQQSYRGTNRVLISFGPAVASFDWILN